MSSLPNESPPLITNTHTHTHTCTHTQDTCTHTHTLAHTLHTHTHTHTHLHTHTHTHIHTHTHTHLHTHTHTLAHTHTHLHTHTTHTYTHTHTTHTHTQDTKLIGPLSKPGSDDSIDDFCLTLVYRKEGIVNLEFTNLIAESPATAEQFQKAVNALTTNMLHAHAAPRILLQKQ